MRALLALFLGDLASAGVSLTEAHAAATKTGVDPGLCWTLHFLGLLSEFSGDDDTADLRYQEALTLGRAEGDISVISVSLNNLADCAYRRGDFERAATLAAEATEVARPNNLTFHLVLALNTQAYIALERGKLAESARLFAEGLTRTGRFINMPFSTADTIAGVASVALATGQPERAARLFGAVAAICERTGLTVLGHDAQQRRAEALARKTLPAGTFETEWDDGRALVPDVALAEARTLADEIVASTWDQDLNTA
jgi:tetratricopeptide (TPR) repeat protein